ncbi:hypothetical protein L1987_60995 [Smallanthus sonchifolius]|uniref:Uncharacterized protein n=1 Tax=Smallanthus sonchifolius TaxID=185202 RepID=A0ACB9D9I8_9ASTR|nr:hypothetical protein L1987_60995 [Smallanthus sonchifolius]
MEDEPCNLLAFFDYIMCRLGLMTHDLHYEFLRRCERILLSVVNDSRFQGFLPSVMAVAVMCIVSKSFVYQFVCFAKVFCFFSAAADYRKIVDC